MHWTALEKRSSVAGIRRRNHEDEIKDLQAKIGELVVERDFLARAFNR